MACSHVFRSARTVAGSAPRPLMVEEPPRPSHDESRDAAPWSERVARHTVSERAGATVTAAVPLPLFALEPELIRARLNARELRHRLLERRGVAAAVGRRRGAHRCGIDLLP